MVYVVYKWYILPIGGLYGTYYLLREPGNSIDFQAPMVGEVFRNKQSGRSSKSCLDVGEFQKQHQKKTKQRSRRT